MSTFSRQWAVVVISAMRFGRGYNGYNAPLLFSVVQQGLPEQRRQLINTDDANCLRFERCLRGLLEVHERAGWCARDTCDVTRLVGIKEFCAGERGTSRMPCAR